MGFIEKRLSTPGPIAVAGRHIKRYHVYGPGYEIEPEVEQAAYRLLPRLLPSGDAATPPAGWVVLHRGADTGAYLLAFSWVWGNALEFHCISAGQPAIGCPDDNPANFVDLDKPWIGCVWELAMLEHERSAWVRHILAPHRPDLDGYLTDALAVEVVGK